MDKKLNNKRFTLPIKIAIAFLIFTEVFYFLGPIDFETKNTATLVLYLIVVNISLYLGFIYCTKKYLPHRARFGGEGSKIVRITETIVLVTVIAKPLSIFVAWQLDSFSFSAFINKFMTGLLSPKDVYDDFNNLKGGSLISLLDVLISPLTYMAIPCGVFYYHNQNRFYKLLTVLLIVLEVVNCLGLGIRKKILDVILIVSFSYLASLGFKPIKLFKNATSVFVFIIAIGGLIFYFIYSTISRIGTDDLSALFVDCTFRPWYIIHTPPGLYGPLAEIQYYLSHAYYNLSVALNHFFSSDFSFIFTFGLGNNSFTLDICDRFLDIDLTPYTYQYLLSNKYGIPIGLQWMNIYPWIANDVTFWGVPFVVFFIGKLFARFWMDSLCRTNYYAIPLLSFMAITIIYSFANNQGLSYSFLPAIIIGFLYFKNPQY